MSIFSMKSAIAVALAALMTAGTASAGEAGKNEELGRWKERASDRVSQTMVYPRLIGRRNLPAGHNVVEAEIDRDGRVLSAELVEGSGRSEFDRASQDFTSRLYKLPALPESIAGETVKVRMHLVYADNEREVARYLKGFVRTRQLADAGRDDAEDAQRPFELFGGIR